MLRYLGEGHRHFGQKPMAPSVRMNWEFYAVVEGGCGLWMGGKPKPEREGLSTSTLWVFPPEFSHGWAGERKRCRVAVFHFGAVPPVLADIVRRKGWLQHTLRAAEVRQVVALARALKPHYENPTELSLVHVQKALLELTLLALEGAGAKRLPTLAGMPQEKVEAATTYFRKNLGERPPLKAVARAVGVSTSHLRRLFMQTRRESPKRAFRRVTMERAMELLSETGLTLEAVAEQCGFAGASELSRAFKREFKVPPALWRQGILPPYQKPVRVGGKFELIQDRDRVARKLKRYGVVS